MDQDALTRLAVTLDLPRTLVDESAAALAQARSCSLAEARERLTRELRVIARVRDVARREHGVVTYGQ